MSNLYEVIIAESAEKDIFTIWSYIAENDGVAQADEIYSGLKKEILKLGYLPGKGHVPPELERIDVYDYLEVHYKPYRIIYCFDKETVDVYAVIDGRRDLMSILSKKIFRL